MVVAFYSHVLDSQRAAANSIGLLIFRLLVSDSQCQSIDQVGGSSQLLVSNITALELRPIVFPNVLNTVFEISSLLVLFHIVGVLED